MKQSKLCLLAAIVTTIAWMTTGCGSSSKPYYSAEHDGRIYVIGSKDMLTSFKDTGHLPYTKTFIGAGPNGETIVAEVQKDDPTYANNLLAAYYDATYFYKEIPHEGRLYILGSEESVTSFMETGHVPLTKTFIGAGPNGETVVVENEKSDTGLTNRLITHFEIKHHTML